jgi:ParB family chromosome partitioning protein
MLSDRLIADLTAHRTAALRDALAASPNTAFAAALHALVLQTFYHSQFLTCLELTVTSAALAHHADALADSAAARSIEARHAGWAARLPQDAADLWRAILAIGSEDRMGLLAHCVSQSVNALRLYSGREPALAHAEVLATSLDLDMLRYWRPTAPAYFARVSKAHILVAVSEAVSGEAASRLAGLKKDAMAEVAATAISETSWLPELLRTKPAEATSTTGSEA